jgi:hypothetical protein
METFPKMAHNMNSSLGEDLSSEGNTLWTVVIARDHDNGNATLRPQARKRDIKQGHRIGRWHRAIVKIAGDQNEVQSSSLRDLTDAIENVFLIIDQRNAMEELSQMPVGGVKKPHGY